MTRGLKDSGYLNEVLPKEDSSRIRNAMDKGELGEFYAVLKEESFQCLERLYGISDRVISERVRNDHLVDEGVGKYWHEALLKVSLLVSLSNQIHHFIGEKAKMGRFVERKELLESLMRLQGKACQISNEVLVLATHGYAGGALARWRSLHEIDVISAILVKYGNDLAIRFLDYYDVEMAQLYVDLLPSFSKRLNLPNPDAKITNTLKDRRVAHCKIHKEHFSKKDGWARTVCKDPSFVNLEKEVGQDYLRFLYKLASSSVHPGAFTSRFDLGVPYIGRDQVLLGPSIHGIYFPIHFMAITLVSIDTRILAIDTSPRSWILRGLLDAILMDIGKELDRCVKSYESKEFKPR
jgi:hypothetical protein